MEICCRILVAAARRRRDPPDRPRAGRQYARGPGPGPPDPARDDAGQEPRGARAPGSRSSSGRCGRSRPACRARMSRVASTSFTEKTEKRLALAGNPGDLRVADWLGIKAIGAIVGGDPVLLPVRRSLGVLGFPFPIGVVLRHHRGPARLHDPGVLARRPRQEAPEGDHPDDPGRPRPADDLRPRRPRLRRRARQGRREAQGPAVGRVPAGAGRGPRRQGAPRRAARHRAAHRGRRR